MRTASEKLAIIRLVEDSELPVRRTLDEINVSRSSYQVPMSGLLRSGLERQECRACPADLNRRIPRSRTRVASCDCSALLLSYW